MKRCPHLPWSAAILAITAICFPCPLVMASFHIMQIEQATGGVNGNTSAQAIQLRQRSFGQNLVQQAQLWARDANGLNPIQLIDFANSVPNPAAGSRILIATSDFARFTSIPLVADFTMTNPIPASYLAAGQITFENNVGSVYWSLNFGGAGYTGLTTGLPDNDDNFPIGDFGPPFGGPLPSTSTSALKFQGAASAKSTTNLADYALTAGAAVFTNNAGTSFTVTTTRTWDGDVGHWTDSTWNGGGLSPIAGNDAVINSGSVEITGSQAANSLTVNGGAITGDGTLNGVVTNAGGLVAPGMSSGLLTFGGSLTATQNQTSATGAHAVPEPSSVLLLVMGLLVTVNARR